MPSDGVSLEVVLQVSLFALPVLGVNCDDLVQGPWLVVHARDHAADVVHPDLMEIEILYLTADMLYALSVKGNVDVAIQVVSIVMVHVDEERHRRVVEHYVPSIVLDNFLMAPSINVAILLQFVQNLSLVMVALDNELIIPVELRENPDPLLVLVRPYNVSENVNNIRWIDSLVPEPDHLLLHGLYVLPWTIIVTKTIKMSKMCI